MISPARGTPAHGWWISLMPAMVMFLTVLSINLLGDVLTERFNMREVIA